jgi:hypothetical protein
MGEIHGSVSGVASFGLLPPTHEKGFGIGSSLWFLFHYYPVSILERKQLPPQTRRRSFIKQGTQM